MRICLYITILFFLIGDILGASINTIKYKGIEIPIVYEKHDTLPIFNMQLVFKNSGYMKDGNLSGLTNLTSKILNEGTKKDGVFEFAKKLESRAISLDIANGFETFNIEVNSLESEHEKALILIKNLLVDPNLTEETLKKIKLLEISKLKEKENDFDFIGRVALQSILFNNTILKNGNYGTVESINKITLKDIQARIKSIFNLNNLIIVAGGELNYDDFKSKLDPILKIFESKNNNNFPIKIKPSNKKEVINIYKNTEQSYVYFGSPYYIEKKINDNYKAKVASFILGGSGFGSRMMEEIRVKEGLAYSAYSRIVNQRTHSYFTGYLQTKLSNTQKAKKMVSSIVNDFVKNGVTQQELDAAKNFLLGSEPLKNETFEQRQNNSFSSFYNDFEQDYPKIELKLIEKLKLSDLNEFIKSHKEIKNLAFAIVTNKGNE